MRIALGLVALTLLGCQSSSTPAVTSAPEPVRVVTSAPPEVVPPAPRRPLARLNPRRQRLEVGDAPPQARPRPLKVGVQVINAPLPARPIYQPPISFPQVQVQPIPPRLPAASWPPPAVPSMGVARGQAQVEAYLAQERERIRHNNEMLLNRPQPGGGLPPEMQRIAYPQVAQPQIGPSLARQQAERRYLEARADFLNTKYVPDGMPNRYTADSVRGAVGTGMPLPPGMMNRPAMFNPVLQKAQQAEVLRQEMVNTR